MAALHKTDEAGRVEGDGWNSHCIQNHLRGNAPLQFFSLYVGASVNS